MEVERAGAALPVRAEVWAEQGCKSPKPATWSCHSPEACSPAPQHGASHAAFPQAASTLPSPTTGPRASPAGLRFQLPLRTILRLCRFPASGQAAPLDLLSLGDQLSAKGEKEGEERSHRLVLLAMKNIL